MLNKVDELQSRVITCKRECAFISSKLSNSSPYGLLEATLIKILETRPNVIFCFYLHFGACILVTVSWIIDCRKICRR